MNRIKKRINTITWGFILLGFVCLFLFKQIGSYIDENGILHEPFFLVIIGVLSVLLGIIIGIVANIRYKFKKD